MPDPRRTVGNLVAGERIREQHTPGLIAALDFEFTLPGWHTGSRRNLKRRLEDCRSIRIDSPPNDERRDRRSLTGNVWRRNKIEHLLEVPAAYPLGKAVRH